MADAVLNVDLKDARVPPQYAQHPLVAGRHFYTLPIELLESVVEQVGEPKFDQELLAVERALSSMSGDHSSQVGFRDGLPILYDLLARPLGLLSFIDQGLAESPELDWNLNAQQRAGLEQADQRLNWASDVRRGYAGWLSLNTAFVSDQNDLFSRHLSDAQQFGLNGASPLPTDPPAVPDTPYHRYVQFAAGRDRFLQHWQALGIAGPYLPVTPSIHAPVLATQLTPSQLGINIFIPSIFPMPDRDQLRLLIENAMGRSRAAAHLAEWMSLVSADTVSKSRISRYGRIFIMQHYWRVLFSRHAKVLDASIGKVKRAFAAFLFPDDEGARLDARADTVHKDLGDVAAARGGPDWYRRPAPYDGL